MSASDLLLADLYRASRDAQEHILAARNAPILYFDAREPFLPLAAGYTLFTHDGPSPSFERVIELRPEEKPAAETAIEYAIWWDWDIHHLYELEHAWVYVDGSGQVVRLEGSWHGRYNALDLRLEGDHALFFSEPGKHAFASGPEPFQERASRVLRSETLFNAPHASVLINAMFEGKIRRKVFDQTLVRSSLAAHIFEPDWVFDQRFTFRPEMLVSWADLEAWIPRRVNACLEDLEASIMPENYRALRLLSTAGTSAGLEAAALAGADGAVLSAGTGPSGQPDLDLEAVFSNLLKFQMGTMIEVQDDSIIPAVAGWLNEKKLYQYGMVTAREGQWLARLKTLAPQAVMVLQAAAADANALHEAKACEAALVNPRGVPADQIAPEWVAQAHAEGLGVLGGPVDSQEGSAALERLGVDGVWILEGKV
jgi:hypothetical protein